MGLPGALGAKARPPVTGAFTRHADATDLEFVMCQLICPNLRCRQLLKVPESARGSTLRCDHCSTLLRVPPARRSVDGNRPAHAVSSVFQSVPPMRVAAVHR